MSKHNPPPGTDDILPDAAPAWIFLEKRAQDIFSLYGYGQIRTPIFEYTELFVRGIGSETEVVRKEMYTFQDKGGRSLTLRPEGTAGIIRALAESAAQGSPAFQRVYYIGPMFRGERPAAGRKRQFHQIGAENLSPLSAQIDAECVVMLSHFLREIGIASSVLKINTRGDASDRLRVGGELRGMLASKKSALCEDCLRRLDDNVWRILDCKKSQCSLAVSELPALDELFSKESRIYLDKVLETLDDNGVPFEKDPRLVRGLDYYAHTVFEFVHSGLGAQNAIAGGGRYEITLQGEKNSIPGVGFACGVERLLMAAEAEGGLNMPCERVGAQVFIISIGE